MLRHVQHLYIQMWLVPVVLFVGSQLFSSGTLLRADAKPLSLKMVGADSLEGSMDGCFHRSSKGRGSLPSNLEQCCFLGVTPLVFSPSKLLTVYIYCFVYLWEQLRDGNDDSICQYMSINAWSILKHPETSIRIHHILLWYPHPDSFQLILKEFNGNHCHSHWMLQCWTKVKCHRDGYVATHITLSAASHLCPCKIEKHRFFLG